MAFSRETMALSLLAALTFVSDASPLVKGVIYTVLCTIARIDWSEATPPNAIESSSAPTPADAGSPAVEDVSVTKDDGGVQATLYPSTEPPPVPDTPPSESKSNRSRTSSVSSTTSLFDKSASEDRPSTPVTEMGDIPEFSTLAVKYQDDPVGPEAEKHLTESMTEPFTEPCATEIAPTIPAQDEAAAPETEKHLTGSLIEPCTESLSEPSTTETVPVITQEEPSKPSQPQPAPPQQATLSLTATPLTAPLLAAPSPSLTKYSMKPSDLVDAVEDFSVPIMTFTGIGKSIASPAPRAPPVPPRPSSGKRSLDEFRESSYSTGTNMAAAGNTKNSPLLMSMMETTAPLASPVVGAPAENSPGVGKNKRKRPGSRQRRRQALRQAGGSLPGPSPLGREE